MTLSSMNDLSALPPDALLGLMGAFRADTRTQKYDLGVGVYKNDDGQTPIMTAVKRAELLLLETNTTKTYEGPRGNIGFCEKIEKLVLGDAHESLAERMTSVSTPGGCGAIYLSVNLAARLHVESTVWVSNPSWPNHAKIARGFGRSVQSYTYLGAKGDAVDIEAMLKDLEGAKAGDLVIVQGPCHNPTGIDFPPVAWNRLTEFLSSRGLLLLVDIAYHGLGDDLDTDLLAIRKNLVNMPEALIAYSCSKNFGLYRERTGCLIALTPSPKAAAAVFTHLADISRLSYSMPPAHGQAIVNAILGDSGLRKSWEGELSEMRARLSQLRTNFLNPIQDIARQSNLMSPRRGMFLQLPLSERAVRNLRDEHGIYIPASGRINIAGLAHATTEALGRLIASQLEEA